MMNTSRKIKSISLALAAVAGFMFTAGSSTEISAQVRDPFAKPASAQPKNPSAAKPTTPGVPKAEKPKPAAPTPVAIPPAQERIDYYKRLRAAAAQQNQAIPNPTVVMTLDEISVTGIFKTPRGAAAMVELKPIKLSFPVYPGEKFFDGQLVAIEENNLIFRKVTKWTNGKFVTSEENKTLREYTFKEEVEGTAPIQTTGKTETASNAALVEPTNTPATTSAPVEPVAAKPVAPAIVSSPLDEMNKQLTEEPKPVAKEKLSKSKKGKAKTSPAEKKPAEKIAKNKDQ